VTTFNMPLEPYYDFSLDSSNDDPLETNSVLHSPIYPDCATRLGDRGRFPAKGRPDKNATALSAGKILNEYCYRCHRGAGSSSGRQVFNVRDAQSMVGASLIVAEDTSSDLLLAVREKRMPPRNQGLPSPSPGEYEVLQKWMADGAIDFPDPPRRPFISLIATERAILNHFQKLPVADRSDYRYFTMTHLHNDPQVDDRHLRMFRAGLAKAINSLSWQAKMVPPSVVSIEGYDKPDDGLIYAIDLKEIGWTRQHWTEINDAYPYLAPGETSNNSQRQELARDFIRLRAGDRCVAQASKRLKRPSRSKTNDRLGLGEGT